MVSRIATAAAVTPRAERLDSTRAAGVATRAGRLDYTRLVGGVRVVVLDTINRAGGSAPIVNADQLAWLRGVLAGGPPTLVLAHQSLPEAVLQVLDSSSTVIAAVTGHSHRNRIRRRGRYWEISTASLADFPQQARMLRVLRTPGGAIALVTWMVDQDGRGLAGVSRELAFLDAQGGRPGGFAGARSDRNRVLAVPR